MMCDNCRAYNGHVLYLEDMRMILCPRCLKILKDLNQEYQDVVRVDELTSTSHIERECIE
jgi:hypothetical protein